MLAARNHPVYMVRHHDKFAHMISLAVEVSQGIGDDVGDPRFAQDTIAVATIELSIAAMKVAIMTAASTSPRADLALIGGLSRSCVQNMGTYFTQAVSPILNV